MIYIVSFCLSIVFLNLGLKQKNKKIGLIFEIIGLLIPCILAGMRSINIGTDTKGYPFKLYNYAGEVFSFRELIKFSNKWYLSIDYLYLLITYLFGHFHWPFQMYLFVLECLMIFPYYCAVKKELNEKNSILAAMIIFYLTFYNLSLNMIRQAISISFAILSFSIFKNKNLIQSNNKRIFISLLILLMGYLFHNTALIILPFYVMYLVYNCEKIGYKWKKLLSLLICFLFLFLILFHNQIFNLISDLGIYNKVNLYINSYNNFNIDYTGTILNLLIIFYIICEKNKIIINKAEYLFAFTISICNLMMAFLGSYIKYANRISYYLFFMLLSSYLPLIFQKNNKLDKKQKYLRIFIIITFIIDWIIVIYIKNSNETIPYEFFFYK